MLLKNTDVLEKIDIHNSLITNTNDYSIEDIIRLIDEQMGSLGKYNHLYDYMGMFFDNFLYVEGDRDSIFDSYIYMVVSDEQKEFIAFFCDELMGLFRKHFGIEYTEFPPLRVVYHLYLTLVINNYYYISSYMKGLAVPFNQYIENPQDYDICNVEKKDMFKNVNDVLQRRSQAIDFLIEYIADGALYPTYLYNIISYHSEGNESVDVLSTEFDSNRLNVEEYIFTSKFKKIMTSDIGLISIREEYMNGIKNPVML